MKVVDVDMEFICASVLFCVLVCNCIEGVCTVPEWWKTEKGTLLRWASQQFFCGFRCK